MPPSSLATPVGDRPAEVGRAQQKKLCRRGRGGYSKGVPDMNLSKPCPARTCPGDEAERDRVCEVLGRHFFRDYGDSDDTVLDIQGVSGNRSSLPREVIDVVFASNFFNHHLPVTERSFVEALHLAGLRPIESGLGSSRSSP